MTMKSMGINFAPILSLAASFLFAGIPVSMAHYVMAAVLDDVL
ncbi:MAG: hypothetical protein PVF10_08505 [Syntrophobacterales bacterium]